MQTIEYNTVRPHVRSGDLIAFQGKGIASRLIRSWTASLYSHVGIAMWLCAGGAKPRLFLVEAAGSRGVTMRLLSSAGSCWYVPTNIAWNTHVNAFVWPRLGTAQYDWWSIGRRIALRRPKRDGVYYCSEFAGEVLLRGGMKLPVEALSDPGALVEAVLHFGSSQIFALQYPPNRTAK